jgi:hypothetical protein
VNILGKLFRKDVDLVAEYEHREILLVHKEADAAFVPTTVML